MTEPSMWMSIAALVLVGISALGLLRMRRELAELRSSAAELVPEEPLPPELIKLVGDSSIVLSLQVLNPMELAAQKHWLAGAAGRLTPGVVQPIVANEVLRMVRSEMLRFDVKADVRLVSRG